jgi:AcrR family transcriptional regulator
LPSTSHRHVSPTSTSRRPRSRRGSGDQLRGEILAAASTLLSGVDTASEISTRAIAEAVGVSVMSIYHHFSNKQELLDAVVAEVFSQLDEAVHLSAAGIDNPLEILCAQASAYVQFALHHPAHYCYATMERARRDGRQRQLDAVPVDVVCDPFVATVTACMDANAIERADPVTVALEIWTAAHGVAALLIRQPSLPWGDKIQFANRVVRSAILGHAAATTRSRHAA